MLHELSFCCDALVVMLSALSSVAVRCNPLRSRLQPHVLEAAAPCARACNPMCSRLQPHVLEAATLCSRACNPMCSRLQPHALEAATPCARDAHAHAHAHAPAPVNACAGARDQCAPCLCRHSDQPALAHPVRACAHLRGQQGGLRRGSIAGSGRCRRVAFEPVLRYPWPCVTWGRGRCSSEVHGGPRNAACWPRETVESRIELSYG